MDPTGIHIPENTSLTSTLRQVSLGIGLALTCSALVILFGWATNNLLLKSLLPSSPAISVTTTLGLLLCSAIIILEEKISEKDYLRQKTKMSMGTLSAALGLIVIALGVSQIQIEMGIGISLIALGAATVFARIKTNHHYHIVHILILVALSLNSMAMLNHAYKIFFPISLKVPTVPLNIAILFFLLCAAFSLRWPGRGFIGIFTTDTGSSMFAIRLLVVSVVSTSILGFIVLLGTKLGLYEDHEEVAIFAILLIILSTILSWLNSKLVYKMELERFLLREQLRIHNIDLTLGNEDLTTKMRGLEKRNEEFADKLDNREKLQDFE